MNAVQASEADPGQHSWMALILTAAILASIVVLVASNGGGGAGPTLTRLPEPPATSIRAAGSNAADAAGIPQPAPAPNLR